MGYTHYWKWNTLPDPGRFAQWSEDVKTLIDSLFLYPELTGGALNICGPDGTGSPVLTATKVAFNGDEAEDEAHESFIIDLHSPKPLSALLGATFPDDMALFDSFCKTAREPYDLVVTAALIRLAHHFPDVEISSDGWLEDWQEGSQLCQQIFGSGAIPFSDEDDDDDDPGDDTF